MSGADPVGMALRMTAAHDYVANSRDEDIRPNHLSWLKHMMTDIHHAGGLDVLTTSEIVSTIVALQSAHSRIIGGTERDGDATILHLVR